MALTDTRLEQEFCARGFIRAAQYLANMLASADVLAESRELIRGTFLADLVCVCRAADRERCPECILGEEEIALLRRMVRQVVDTGFMALEDLGAPSNTMGVVLPVTVRGRTETAMVIAYRGVPSVPPHALEALLGVVGLVGAALARQQADRELVLLAEERAARAVAEVTERRTRLLSEASKTLFASFDAEGTLASVARLVVRQLGDWCAIELRDPERPGTTRQVTFVHTDPEGGEPRELRVPPGADPAQVAPRVMTRRGQAELHSEVPEAFLPEWARDARQLDAVRSLGLASAMVVPIVSRGALFGGIAIGAGPRRRYGTEDLALAEEIGLRAGTAIENAGLYLQAQQAIGVRDQFLAIASHELKTPLTALMLVIETAERALERMPVPSERMRSKIGVLARQGQRLSQLVSNLLDVARIQAGRLHVSLEPVDLCAVVREVIERHEQDASRAGCAVTFDAGEPITGAWDQSRVDQVVSNLLSNAIKYGAGKPVSLAARLDGGIARLTVADQGIGVAPDDHERIFLRFERAVGNGGTEGMGLGLWITREIVTRLGGSIRVESRLGSGARFTVELPIRPEPRDGPP